MAVRQYVGARYVPIFYQNSQNPLSSEWEDNKAYEALTIVTYNSSSYTSKIPVPAGIGNPAQNPTYWVVTGNYNAQVEHYRQTTEDYKLTVEDVKKQADTIESSLDTNVENLIRLNNFRHCKIICIGDSYGLGGTTQTGYGWPHYLESLTGSTVYNYSVNGTGFVGIHSESTFQKQLELAYDQHPDADYVIIAGGTNDIVTWGPNSPQAISSALQFAITHFVNNKIYLFYDSVLMNYDDNATRVNALNCMNQYGEIAGTMGVPYQNIAPIARIHPNVTASDEVHLNESGYRYLATAIINTISGCDLCSFVRQLTTARVEGQTGNGHLKISNTDLTLNCIDPYNVTFPAKEEAITLNNYNLGIYMLEPDDYPNLFKHLIDTGFTATGYVDLNDSHLYVPCEIVLRHVIGTTGLSAFVTSYTTAAFNVIEANHAPTLQMTAISSIPILYTL